MSEDRKRAEVVEHIMTAVDGWDECRWRSNLPAEATKALLVASARMTTGYQNGDDDAFFVGTLEVRDALFHLDRFLLTQASLTADPERWRSLTAQFMADREITWEQLFEGFFDREFGETTVQAKTRPDGTMTLTIEPSGGGEDGWMHVSDEEAEQAKRDPLFPPPDPD